MDLPHLGSTSQSELNYRLAWTRTYLKKYGLITNSERSVWSITSKYVSIDCIDEKEIVKHFLKVTSGSINSNQSEGINKVNELPETNIELSDDAEYPDEAKPWKTRLLNILYEMNPFDFENLSKRLLRECGFSQVNVTSKSGDGGIDGKGKLSINGIFSFNVAFQCKRYKGIVGPEKVREFRGSLSNSIEKGVLITTGTFSRKAREDASNPGKQQIDLIDGEEFINKLAEYGIGVKRVSTFEIDEDFFRKSNY